MNKRKTLVFLLTLSATQISQANSKPINNGVALYNTACQLCHSAQKAKSMHAPAAFDVAAWKLRYESANNEVKNKLKFKTADDYFLYQVSIGKGLMHHGGLCKESKLNYPQLKCDEKTYLEAIHYMSNKKP